jgi:hypothetical protein
LNEIIPVIPVIPGTPAVKQLFFTQLQPPELINRTKPSRIQEFRFIRKKLSIKARRVLLATGPNPPPAIRSGPAPHSFWFDIR